MQELFEKVAGLDHREKLVLLTVTEGENQGESSF